MSDNEGSGIAHLRALGGQAGAVERREMIERAKAEVMKVVPYGDDACQRRIDEMCDEFRRLVERQGEGQLSDLEVEAVLGGMRTSLLTEVLNAVRQQAIDAGGEEEMKRLGLIPGADDESSA